MANLGIGIGAFAEGLGRGMDLRVKMDENNRRKKIQAESEAAYKDAAAARQADISTGAEAKPLMDYYMTKAAPRVRDAYLANGDAATAQVWNKWIQSEQVQKGMGYWAAAVRSAQQGDHAGFLKNYVDAYNSNGYFDDGTKAVGSKELKDDKGNTTGFEITFKDKDGKERTQQFNDMEQIYKTGLTFMSPEKVFEYGMNQVKSAQEARGKIADEQRKFNREVALEDRKQGGRFALEGYRSDLNLSRDNNNSNNRVNEAIVKQRNGVGDDPVAKANAMASALKSIGWDDAKIKSEYPRMLGLYRQSSSPAERLRQAMDLLSKTDDKFLDLDENGKAAAAQRLIDAQDKILMQNSSSNQQPTTQTQQQPQGRGIPMFGPNGTFYIPQ